MAHIHRMTEAELFASFLAKANYIERVDLAVAGSVVAVDGIQLVLCDTTVAGFTITLDDPGPDDAPDRWRPIIINVGTNTLTVDPQTAEINGQSGTQTIVTKFAALDLVHNGTDFFTADDIKPSFTPTNLQSFILEYDVADAHVAGDIWSDSGRTTNSVADGAIDNFDASFVDVAAASTPRADRNGAAATSLLRLSPSASLPPTALPIISMFTSGNDGGFDTNWQGIAPFDSFLTGINTPFSLAMVARFTSFAAFGSFFAWVGGDAVSNIEMSIRDTPAGEVFAQKADPASNFATINSNPNVVSGAWETYVIVFDGSTLDVYENAVLLMSEVYTVPTALVQTAGAKSAIGHKYEFPSLNESDALEFDFANLAFFDAAISSGERAALNSYYNARHGL